MGREILPEMAQLTVAQPAAAAKLAKMETLLELPLRSPSHPASAVEQALLADVVALLTQDPGPGGGLLMSSCDSGSMMETRHSIEELELHQITADMEGGANIGLGIEGFGAKQEGGGREAAPGGRIASHEIRISKLE